MPRRLSPLLIALSVAAAGAPSCTPPEKVDLAAKVAQDSEKGKAAENIQIQRTSSLSEADQREVIAKIDDELITLGEYERRLNAQAPFARARYNSLERKKDFLTNMVQFEVLAAEAVRRGLDKDPEVVLEMKQAMVRKLMAHELDKRMSEVKITDEELKAYYDAHVDDYVRPAKVRASQIVLADEQAAKALIEALTLEFAKDPTHKRRTFALKARDVSIDKPTASLGGDMRFFSAAGEPGSTIHKALSDAAFALQHVGDMSPPVQTSTGWHVLMLTAKKERFERSFEEVKRNIHNRLYRERRTTVEQQLVTEVKAKAKVEINNDLLARIKDPEPPKGQPSDGHAHGQEINLVPTDGADDLPTAEDLAPPPPGRRQGRPGPLMSRDEEDRSNERPALAPEPAG